MDEEKVLNFEEIYPDSDLSVFVKHFWHSHNPAGDIIYTILPDGYFDLIVEIEGIAIKNITLFGLYTKSIDINVQSGRTFFGIAFKPLAAEYILKKSISDILNGNKSLPDGFWELNKISMESFGGFVKHTSQKILSILKTGKKIDKRKQKLFELIFSSNGSSHVQNLSNLVFWNSRQINRFFNARFGLSLKVYNNIFRCSASYEDIKAGEFNRHQHYFDQSHFVKEVKKHTGQIPSELHENKNDRILLFNTLP